MGHKWNRVADGNVPLYKCEKCGGWTRSSRQVRPNAQLIDPEDGTNYMVENACSPYEHLEAILANTRWPGMSVELLYVVDGYRAKVGGFLLETLAMGEDIATALFNLNYQPESWHRPQPTWKIEFDYSSIEQHCQLHERLVIKRGCTAHELGFSVQLLYQDGAILGPKLTSYSIEEAMNLMRVYLKDEPREKIRKRFEHQHNPDY